MSLGHRGANLDTGRVIEARDYDIEIDSVPNDLLNKFGENYSQDSWYENVQNVRKLALEEVEHIGSLARELEEDFHELNEERLDQMLENDTLHMSDVWEGWRDNRIIGTCKERGITAVMLYNELDIKSRYHQGELRQENGVRAGHAWATVRNNDGDVYISDPSKSGDGLVKMDETDRYYFTNNLSVNKR